MRCFPPSRTLELRERLLEPGMIPVEKGHPILAVSLERLQTLVVCSVIAPYSTGLGAVDDQQLAERTTQMTNRHRTINQTWVPIPPLKCVHELLALFLIAIVNRVSWHAG